MCIYLLYKKCYFYMNNSIDKIFFGFSLAVSLKLWSMSWHNSIMPQLFCIYCWYYCVKNECCVTKKISSFNTNEISVSRLLCSWLFINFKCGLHRGLTCYRWIVEVKLDIHNSCNSFFLKQFMLIKIDFCH